MVTILDGLAGGLVATVAMTAFMMALGDDSPPPTALLWSKYVGDGPPDDYLPQGMALHFLYGIGAGAVFAAAALALDLGIGDILTGVGWGLAWGLVLFVVGAVFWMKVVLALEPEPKQIGGFLLFHLVYGAVLGAWVGYGILG